MGIAMKKLILIAALLAPSGALAESGSGSEANAKRGTQMVCRAVSETGSRLSKRKLCLTREQWAEQKRIMRSDLNQAQTRRNEPQSN
jgi:ketopantoate reductase